MVEMTAPMKTFGSCQCDVLPKGRRVGTRITYRHLPTLSISQVRNAQCAQHCSPSERANNASGFRARRSAHIVREVRLDDRRCNDAGVIAEEKAADSKEDGRAASRESTHPVETTCTSRFE